MIREAKRKDIEYKRHSTVELAKYLTAFSTINIFDQIKEIVEDGISELNDDDDGDLQMKPMYFHFKNRWITIVDYFYVPIYTL